LVENFITAATWSEGLIMILINPTVILLLNIHWKPLERLPEGQQRRVSEFKCLDSRFGFKSFLWIFHGHAYEVMYIYWQKSFRRILDKLVPLILRSCPNPLPLHMAQPVARKGEHGLSKESLGFPFTDRLSAIRADRGVSI
jgi:hypothetical protein